MNIKSLLVLATIIAAPTILSSCGMSSKDIKTLVNASRNKGEFRDSEKWGKVIDKDIEVSSEFTAIELNGGIDIDITQSDTAKIVIKGNEKAIEAHDITIEDGKFVINKKAEFAKTPNVPSLLVSISAPSIDNIVVNGAGDINFKNDYKIDSHFHICVNGAGDLYIKKLECENINITVNGAGDVTAKTIKCANKADLAVNGAGDIDASVKANAINASISGAGDADLDVDCNNLYTSVSGTGDMKLKGKCKNFHKSEDGMASVDSRGLKYEKKN